jgi:hypothetical protein
MNDNSTQKPPGGPDNLAQLFTRQVTDGVNKLTLLQSGFAAKPKATSDPEVQRMVDSIMQLSPRHEAMKCALKEYLLTERPLSEIAAEHSYSGPAVTYWLRKLHLRRRRRGRPSSRPSAKGQQIIDLVRSHGMVQAARRTGVSRQRVHEVVSRWAPELKGRGRIRKLLQVAEPKRRLRRNFVVSFRVTSEDWQRLIASQPTPQTNGSSAGAKARGIVLKELGLAFTGAAALKQRSPSSGEAVGLQPPEIVNVYTSPSGLKAVTS